MFIQIFGVRCYGYDDDTQPYNFVLFFSLKIQEKNVQRGKTLKFSN